MVLYLFNAINMGAIILSLDLVQWLYCSLYILPLGTEVSKIKSLICMHIKTDTTLNSVMEKMILYISLTYLNFKCMQLHLLY